MNKSIIENMNNHNKNLTSFACKDDEAIRLSDSKEDYRTPFFKDIDKVLYSSAYTRYIDKTQVYSNNDNDMISKRMTHVQMVSKIARTIGRALGLNEDLIEAASLAHDLGHVPYGHLGESILNDISLKNNQGIFAHNVQSVRVLMNLENNGLGSNLTIQVLDAVFCHNGEILEGKYYPMEKTMDQFLNEYNACYFNEAILKDCHPMTLEGCVVRISDIISYVGKDIEDAIRLNKIDISLVPSDITNVLGKCNKEIVDILVNDIITNSIGKNYIALSPEIFSVLQKLIDFNYKNIYNNVMTQEAKKIIREKFEYLFEIYLNHLNNKMYDEDIWKLFLNDMCDEYKNSNCNERMIIDYIAGMTDDFFESQYLKYKKLDNEISSII